MHGILKKYLGQTLSEHKSGIANISYVNDDEIAQIVNITKSLDLKGKKGLNSPKNKKVAWSKHVATQGKAARF